MSARLFMVVGLVCFAASGCSQNTVNTTFWRDHFPQNHYVRLGPIDTRYEITGHGPPLILLHGLGGSLEDFNENIGPLAEHFTVYSLDLRGMGYSSKPDGYEYSIGMQVLHVLAFMRYFKIEKADFIGHSMGGSLALILAIYMPERVNRLVLCDPPVYQAKLPTLTMRMITNPILGKFAEWFPTRAATRAVLKEIYEDDERFVTPEHVERIYNVFTMPGSAHAFREYLVRIPFTEVKLMEPMYDEIEAPTLILWGEKDAWFPPERGEKLHKALKHSEFHLIPNTGHMVVREGAQDVNRYALEFLLRP